MASAGPVFPGAGFFIAVPAAAAYVVGMERWDTHCHLQNGRFDDVNAVMERAAAAGVAHLVCCGTCERDWPAVKSLADAYPERIIPAYGIHPRYLGGRGGTWRESLKGYLRDPRAVVGEIGLDHAPDISADRDEQLDVFRDQVLLARESGRAVSIHCRRAWDALKSVLRECGPFVRGGVVHSYGGSVQSVRELVPFNCYFSYSCSLANPANKRSARSLAAVPPDRLLTETDSPDIRPRGWKGPNEPANAALVTAAMSRLLNESEAVISRRTAATARRVFLHGE